MDRDALRELLAKVEAGETLRSSAFSPMKDDPDCRGWARMAHNGSLDAAKALHEAVMPGCKVKITDTGEEYEDIGRWAATINWDHMEWQPTFTAPGPFGHTGLSNDPARAWLIAILSALIAEVE